VKKTILVVDDSLTIRQQLRICLEDAGFAVLEAENGEQGLEMARGALFDFMIVDVRMPGIDGLEMLDEVRRIPMHVHTPVFVLSTESNTDMRERGKAVGVTAWIVKPCRPEVLVEGIRRVLGSSKAS
jgi:two-component system chemotaxis response regulator CheY